MTVGDRPSHIESSCCISLATLSFSGLLIPFHTVVPASITAGTPLQLRGALATPPCYAAWAKFGVATIEQHQRRRHQPVPLGQWDRSSQRPLLVLTSSLLQDILLADCADA